MSVLRARATSIIRTLDHILTNDKNKFQLEQTHFLSSYHFISISCNHYQQIAVTLFTPFKSAFPCINSNKSNIKKSRKNRKILLILRRHSNYRLWLTLFFSRSVLRFLFFRSPFFIEDFAAHLRHKWS